MLRPSFFLRVSILLKRISSACVVLLISLQLPSCHQAEVTTWTIVPQPNTINLKAGVFDFGKGVNYLPHPKALDEVMRSFQTRLSHLGVPAGTDSSPAIQIKVSNLEKTGAEAYQLDVSPDSLVITAATAQGAFYGLTTIEFGALVLMAG